MNECHLMPVRHFSTGSFILFFLRRKLCCDSIGIDLLAVVLSPMRPPLVMWLPAAAAVAVVRFSHRMLRRGKEDVRTSCGCACVCLHASVFYSIHWKTINDDNFKVLSDCACDRPPDFHCWHQTQLYRLLIYCRSVFPTPTSLSQLRCFVGVGFFFILTVQDYTGY